MSLLLKVLLILLGLLLVLLAVAIVRAVLIRRPLSGAQSAIAYTPQEEALYAERLSKMIQVPTVSLRGQHDLTQFRRLQEVLRALYPNIHARMERIDLDGNLLLRWPGRDPNREGLLLMGHQDVVVAAEREWTHDPFSGAIEDGRVHGRGAMDCKCTVCAEFAAVEELLAEGFQPPCDIYLASSVDEEITGDGAPRTVQYLKEHGVRLAAVMDEGGAIASGVMPGLDCLCAVVGTVEKGYADVKLVAHGAGGHSSTPPRGTPIARLSACIAEMERKRPYKKQMAKPVRDMFSAMAPYMSFPMRLLFGNLWLFSGLLGWLLPLVSSYGESLVATTFAFTVCGGGKTPNVIPDEAWAICNLRPAVHQNAEESIAVLRHYAEKYDLELEVLEARDASDPVDPAGAEYQYLRGCINSCFPQVAVAPYYISGGTDCRNYQAVSDNCLRFCPVRMEPQQLDAMHAANENICTDALAESVKFYKYYLSHHA